MTVDRIRDNLKMLEQNLGHFNDVALNFIDVDDIREYISHWRYFVSHKYFEKDKPRPEGICSNPPISWLDGILQGLSVPLSRDIGTCIEPVVTSYLATEGAARRIRDRLSMIFSYVTDEDAKKDQEAAFERNIEEPKRRKTHAAEQARYRAREKEKKDHRTPEQIVKLGEDYLKKKNKQREKYKKESDEKRKIEQERYLAEGRKVKKLGVQA